MDILSQANLSNLSYASQDSIFLDEEFSILAKHVFEIALQLANSEVDQPINFLFSEKDQSIVEASYTSLITLILEAAKQDIEKDQLEVILDDCNFMPNRKEIFIQLFEQHKQEIRNILSRFGIDIQKIIDLNWKLNYQFKNNKISKINNLQYSISLKKENNETIDFQCSTEELQNMLSMFKEAAKMVDKATQI